MSEVLKMYEQFVTEENQLCRRIETLNIIQSYILHTVHKHGPELDMLTVEEVMLSIHHIQQDLQTELIHVRLEKSLLAHNHNYSSNLGVSSPEPPKEPV
ncbi:hypothetical protein [Paenibacillus sp. FSL H8-0537]|uniref:hypothetical protein n=1 Tax=Paenibacillus sp. FSL H8-0537 TaxID=2921399 RepID=UPI00310112E0